MALTSTINLNVPSNTSQIIFYDPSEMDNITYTIGTGISYASEPTITISQTDLALYAANKLAFYNSLLLNFPKLNNSYQSMLPSCQIKLDAVSAANLINFYQVSTISSVLVYNISFNTSTLQATFAARTSPITITEQEYLNAFQILRQFFAQCQLA